MKKAVRVAGGILLAWVAAFAVGVDAAPRGNGAEAPVECMRVAA